MAAMRTYYFECRNWAGAEEILIPEEDLGLIVC
jgi:hypothetical protein